MGSVKLLCVVALACYGRRVFSFVIVAISNQNFWRKDMYVSQMLSSIKDIHLTLLTKTEFKAGTCWWSQNKEKKEKEKGEKREKKRIRLALLKVILLTSSL